MKNPLIINREDFDQICRCCLKKVPLASLLEIMYEDVSFLGIFLNVFSEQINFNDELPKSVCEKCISKIIHCYNFKKSYYISLKTLTTIIENSATGTTAEDSEPAKNTEEHLLIEDKKIVVPDDFTRNVDGLDEKENVKLDEDPDLSLDKEDLDIKEETIMIISNLENETVNEKNIPESYSCEQCPSEKFNNRSTLSRHKPTKHQTTCDICKKSFMTRATLQVHKRIHSLLAASKNENSDSEKEKESKSIAEPKIHACILCSKTFKSRRQLTKHKKEENHTAPAKIACEICNKVISRHRKSDHIRNCHSGKKPFICEYCGMAFTIKKNFCLHVMTHTGERPYVCEICEKGFIRKTSLIEHGRSHTGEKPFLCDYCGETCSLYSSYRYHLIKEHTAKLNFQCKICNKFLSSKPSLTIHMRIHTGQKNYFCTQCRKNFITKGILQSHLISHSNEKKFTCNLCGKSYRRYLSFKNHQTIHSEERPFTCKICSKTFRLKIHLTVHLRTHTGEKPYACPYCDKSFSHITTRIVHVRSHTGEKPYVCDVCSKGFYHSSSMTKHRQTHLKNGATIKF